VRVRRSCHERGGLVAGCQPGFTRPAPPLRWCVLRVNPAWFFSCSRGLVVACGGWSGLVLGPIATAGPVAAGAGALRFGARSGRCRRRLGMGTPRQGVALSRCGPRAVPSRHSDTRRGPFGCRVTGRGSAGPGPARLRVRSCRMRRPWGCCRPGGEFLPVKVCWALSCPVPDIPGRRYRPFRGRPVAGRCARQPIVDAAAGGTGGIEGGIPWVSFGRRLLP
jgi:hypothetical protein